MRGLKISLQPNIPFSMSDFKKTEMDEVVRKTRGIATQPIKE